MKIFEDSFSNILTGMVYLALDYCGKSVDTIFIHCSNENNCISSNVFFKKGSKKIRRSQISEKTSDNQKELIQSINEKIKDLELLCISNNQAVPTEIRLVYEVSSKDLKSDFSYERLYSDFNSVVVQDVFDEWFESF